MNISGGERAIRKNPLEEISPTQTTASVESKARQKRNEKQIEPNPVKPAEFLSKAETKQVLERFEPLPPVLHKALQGTQTLRREFQAIERLTSPKNQTIQESPLPRTTPVVLAKATESSANLSKSIPELSKPFLQETPTSQAKVTAPPHVATALNTAGISIRIVAQPFSLTRENGTPVPLFRPETAQLKTLMPPVVSTREVIHQPSKPSATKQIIPEISTSVISLPTKPVVQESIQPKAVSIKSTIISPVKPGPANVSGFIPVKVENKDSVPRDINHEKLVATNSKGEGKSLVPEIPVSSVASNRINSLMIKTSVASIAPPIVVRSAVKRGEPPPKVLVAGPSIDVKNPNITSSAVTLQSNTQTARLVIAPVGGSELPSHVIPGKNFLMFQRKLREQGNQSFVAEARQAVHLQQVHPLTIPFVEPQPIVTQRNIRLPELNTTGIETVARTPIRRDNGAQPQTAAVKPLLPPENVTGLRITSNISGISPPPLSDISRLRRTLPTNGRSRLVQIPTVNILDLVL